MSFGFTSGEYVIYHFKTRIFALLLIIVSVGLVYYNWQQLLQQGEYSTKLAAFAPLVGIGGLFWLIFPAMGGKPETAREKLIVLSVFVIGLAAGLYNLYLMNPGFFGM